ncbi:hypothetical protein D3C71_1602360 [compost metagenome]
MTTAGAKPSGAADGLALSAASAASPAFLAASAERSWIKRERIESLTLSRGGTWAGSRLATRTASMTAGDSSMTPEFCFSRSTSGENRIWRTRGLSSSSASGLSAAEPGPALSAGKRPSRVTPEAVRSFRPTASAAGCRLSRWS